MPVARSLRLFLAPVLAATASLGLSAQVTPGGRVVLVLPFENRSGDASLAWVGDSFPDTLDRRLNSAGFLTIGPADRAYAFDHLGLPGDFRPSRATTIRVAQQLDANFVVIGSFTVSAGHINIQSQVLAVQPLTLSAPQQDSAELSRLFDAENAIAWKVARVMDPTLHVAEGTFLAAPGAVPLPAFEAYIRGTNAPTASERLQRLKQAVQLVPNYTAALLAYGKEQYAAHDYTGAAETLSRIPPSDPLALEGGFYLGLARFNSNDYKGAQAAFDATAARLPLPEVLNDQGVSLSRQGKDAVAVFQKALAADPNNEDAHYNLAVSWFRRGDITNARNEAEAAVKLKPSDADAVQLRARLATTPPGTKLSTVDNAAFLPVERLVRTYSEASFRQAAFQLAQVRDARLATLPPMQRSAEYTAAGNEMLATGLLPQAEQEFQSAVAADPTNAAAHVGLARIRQASGNAADARAELQTSLNLKPTVDALLLLAQLDQAAGNVPAAVADVNRAVALEPKNPKVIAMQMSLAKPQTPKP